MSIRSAAAAAGLLLAAAYDNGGAGAFPMRGWSTWWCVAAYALSVSHATQAALVSPAFPCSTDDYCGLLDLCFEKEIHEIADALVSTGMRELNYTTLLLDDCGSPQCLAIVV